MTYTVFFTDFAQTNVSDAIWHTDDVKTKREAWDIVKLSRDLPSSVCISVCENDRDTMTEIYAEWGRVYV